MDTKGIAQYALDALKKAGADKASCQAFKWRKDEFNVEANEFSLLRTVFEDELHLKALVGGRKGSTVINKLDRDSIDTAVEGCITLAKASVPDEAEDIAPLVENKDFVIGEAKNDLDGLFKRSKEYLAQVRDEFPKIVIRDHLSYCKGGESAYVNSNGVNFGTKYEHYYFHSMFMAKEGERGTSFNYDGAILRDTSRPFLESGMHKTLLEESVKSLNTRMVDEKFTGKIIVTPACADMIWYTIISNFLGDRALIEGTSRWKDALGTQVADKKLTMRAVPLNENVVDGWRYTGDGFATKDIDLIRDGVLKSFTLGLYGSNKTGKPRADTSVNNIEVLPGDVALADMLKGVERGVLVNRFSGGSPGPSGDVSGVAKNSFLIENGVVTDALQETMISFNILDALKNITAISKETIANGASILPWCCFDGITVSGK